METQGGVQSGIVEMPIPKSMALQLGLLLEVMKKSGDSHTSLCMFFTLQDCWHIFWNCVPVEVGHYNVKVGYFTRDFTSLFDPGHIHLPYLPKQCCHKWKPLHVHTNVLDNTKWLLMRYAQCIVEKLTLRSERIKLYIYFEGSFGIF